MLKILSSCIYESSPLVSPILCYFFVEVKRTFVKIGHLMHVFVCVPFLFNDLEIHFSSLRYGIDVRMIVCSESYEWLLRQAGVMTEFWIGYSKEL